MENNNIKVSIIMPVYKVEEYVGKAIESIQAQTGISVGGKRVSIGEWKMENNNIKVSIIMPVYKVEEYVGKAIESIQAQTLKEWEFLIVDDGTPDKSGDNIKVSIIMPVYKVEEYVGKAIESIQAQTLKEWEFLIVDDGTPDKSGEICDDYAEKDDRIHVIHKENGGAPSARNMAIEMAKGEYFYFLDSDDWAEPTMLEDMYNLAKRDNAQLVVAGFYIDTYCGKDGYMTDDYYVEDAVYPNKESFRRNAYKLFDKNLLYTPWNKLFEAKYVMENNLRFPTTFWDDFPFNVSVVRHILWKRRLYDRRLLCRRRGLSEQGIFPPKCI